VVKAQGPEFNPQYQQQQQQQQNTILCGTQNKIMVDSLMEQI
jgi:hypothetical protein